MDTDVLLSTSESVADGLDPVFADHSEPVVSDGSKPVVAYGLEPARLSLVPGDPPGSLINFR